MENKQIFKTLPCQLTDDELIKKVNEVSSIQCDYDTAWSNKKKHELEARRLKNDIDKLLHQISTRTEYREVGCCWVYNWDSGYKYLVRSDTSERLNSLPIEDHERQQNLPL